MRNLVDQSDRKCQYNSFVYYFSLLCLLLLAILLAACGDPATPSSGIGPIDSPTTHAQVVTPALMGAGHFSEYALPRGDDGLMRPAIDHEGRIWFGEMNRNYLAVFDPRTQKFSQMSPPHGQFGIMGVEVAADDTIWFAEQYADYIGHYSPATGRYGIYSLPTITVPDPSDASKTMNLPSAPNDLVLDTHGNVWFTELNADSVGRLDPHTGSIRQYPVSAKKSAQALNPYGITIDSRGNVWFTEASGSSVGRLDPSTGQVSSFSTQRLNAVPMEITSDAHGTLWITTFNSVLLSLDPATGKFTSYYAPTTNGTGGSSGGMYGVVVTQTGSVWITLAAQNVIARFDTTSSRFTYYTIPTSSSLPLGIVQGANNIFWFTEAGSNKIGMLEP